ncbi:ParD-like family protein [Pseudomonas graminis]|uniref:ParD-like antitoxin of type II toxin-antitoxin system n=1 Tax=Pseudomonas graminis TaxID=158627 RepID=A0A1I0CP26_9PSED|nr:ParD-like family protein [Pseudomonas graminis]SET20782.1 ParD-like antitoxin of type II toxin-antitoxin system [Pseudomonas graminis]
MGLVKISEQMHANIRCASAALSRSINAQAEHWMRVGMLAELHPGLNYSEICQLLIRAETSGGAVLSLQPCDLVPDLASARAVSQ